MYGRRGGFWCTRRWEWRVWLAGGYGPYGIGEWGRQWKEVDEQEN